MKTAEEFNAYLKEVANKEMGLKEAAREYERLNNITWAMETFEIATVSKESLAGAYKACYKAVPSTIRDMYEEASRDYLDALDCPNNIEEMLRWMRSLNDVSARQAARIWKYAHEEI